MSKKRPGAPSLPMIVPNPGNREDARRGVALMLMLLLVGFGLFNLFQGSTGAIRNVNFVNDGVAAEGRVLRIATTELPRLGGLGMRSTNNAVVQFSAKGVPVEFVNPSECGTRCPQAGEIVPVSYLAAEPARAMINSFASVWGPWLQNFIVSLMSLAGAAVAFLYTKPVRKDLPGPSAKIARN
jgi:hypothetical protein